MEEERRMRPIFFHYLRLGCLEWLTLLCFWSKDRHNTDGPLSRQAEEKSKRKGRVGHNQKIGCIREGKRHRVSEGIRKKMSDRQQMQPQRPHPG